MTNQREKIRPHKILKKEYSIFQLLEEVSNGDLDYCASIIANNEVISRFSPEKIARHIDELELNYLSGRGTKYFATGKEAFALSLLVIDARNSIRRAITLQSEPFYEIARARELVNFIEKALVMFEKPLDDRLT